jgi:HPt (histidine-containing phosphotransfer) domain-containing protein
MAQRSRRPEPPSRNAVPPSPNPAAELAELRARYRQEMPQKIRAVKEAAQALGEGAGREELEALHILAHRLVGSAAIYGFAEVSQAAAALEVFVVRALETSDQPEGSWAEPLAALVAAIERAADEGPGH